MKRLLTAAIAAATIAVPALAAEVGVSISIGDPGFYGRLDIGGYPQPQVINRQPIFVERVPMDRPPVYLRVPPGHAKNWRKHCHEYNACGERVYFVQDNWYNREYAPRYQKQHGDRQDYGRGGHGNDRQDKNRGRGRERQWHKSNANNSYLHNVARVLAPHLPRNDRQRSKIICVTCALAHRTLLKRGGSSLNSQWRSHIEFEAIE